MRALTLSVTALCMLWRILSNCEGQTLDISEAGITYRRGEMTPCHGPQELIASCCQSCQGCLGSLRWLCPDACA